MFIYKAVQRLFSQSLSLVIADYILIYTVGLGAGLACCQYTTDIVGQLFTCSAPTTIGQPQY